MKKGGGLSEGDTKTYAGTRTILLPHSTAQLLQQRKRTALTEWIFPDPLRPENPTHPGGAYRQLKRLLLVKPKTQIFYPLFLNKLSCI